MGVIAGESDIKYRTKPIERLSATQLINQRVRSRSFDIKSAATLFRTGFLPLKTSDPSRSAMALFHTVSGIKPYTCLVASGYFDRVIARHWMHPARDGIYAASQVRQRCRDTA